jgi:glycosidase
MARENSKHEKIVIYQLFPRLFSNTNTLNKKYGTIEENGCGKMNHITDRALSEIRNLGVTHIWFLGVLEHATCSNYSKFGIEPDNPIVVKGKAGSPYAIKDYYDIDPDLAEDVPNRMSEFENLVFRCQSKGLKVIIDFVPNHVARQYHSDAKPSRIKDFGEKDDQSKSFLASNNYYYLPGLGLKLPASLKQLPYVAHTATEEYKEFPAKVTGNDMFSNSVSMHDWYETVKLNYGVDYQDDNAKHFNPVPDTWYKMLEILHFWASKKIDGFRCDMVEMVPVEFWEWAIVQVKEVFPEIIFIAEIYNPSVYKEYLVKGKFDYLYDKEGFYDTLRNVITHKIPTWSISREISKINGIENHMLRFLENHDEQRIASNYFASDPIKAVPAMGLAALMHNGPVMIYFGQEHGEPARGETGFSSDDGRTSIFDYCSVPEHLKWVNEGKFDGGQLSESQWKLREFYYRLLNLSHNKVFAGGEFYDLMWYNSDSLHFEEGHIFTFLRYVDERYFLVVANFHSGEALKLQIKFPKDVLDIFHVEDRFSVFGKDRLWDDKVFFSDGIEFMDNGLVMVSEPNSVYAFELEITLH